MLAEGLCSARGLSLDGLAQALRVAPRHLEEPVGALVALDWLGRLDEDGERYVLLVDPTLTPMAPMVERLLLARQPNTARFWSESHWAGITLAQAGVLLAANRLVRIFGYRHVLNFYARNGDRLTCMIAAGVGPTKHIMKSSRASSSEDSSSSSYSVS